MILSSPQWQCELLVLDTKPWMPFRGETALMDRSEGRDAGSGGESRLDREHGAVSWKGREQWVTVRDVRG